MSEHTSTLNAEPKTAEAAASIKAARQRRWTFYALSGAVALLVLAYIGGGEEPIHPIVQQIALPSNSGASE